MRIRVVDSKGQPIRDVRFAAENWCGYRAVALLRRKTDEEGRILWDSAPSDTVRCCFLKSGYMTVRETPLVASDEEHVITLRPALVITGRVTDAKTGQPISTLEIRHGRLRPTSTKPEWAEQAVSFRDGAYRCEFDEPSGGRYALLVAAEGYQPVESRPFQIDEGTVTLDLALRPGQDRSAPSEAIVYSRQTTEGDEDATKRNRLVVHATAKETGKPLGGVKIRFDGGFEREVETNDEGIVSIEWDARAEFGRLFVSCFKSGFVPIHCLWGSGRGESDLPEDVHLRFQAGKWIGGIVQDQDGRPIEGATVKVRKIVDLPKPAYYWHNVAELKTDAEGRWRWKGVPSDLSHFGIDVSHPSYVERLHQLTAGTETPYVIKQGRRVTGRVLTADGTPIEGATALFADDRSMAAARKVSTNSEGQFMLENCMPGESLVTVQADGHSPTQREIVVGEQEDVGEFRLAKGHTLRVRIVDSRGDPPKSAYLKVESWQGREALSYFANADEEGRVVWQSAPEDTVLCTIRGAGCSELTNYPLQASDEEHVVTLGSELIITGNVTDAKTGQPIPSFVICPGFDWSSNGMFWAWDRENHYKGGVYQWNPRGQIAGAHRLRVDAPGYHTKTSRLFKPDEGSVTFDFSLERGTDMVGTVLNAGGDPAPDARVGLAKAASRASLRDGHFFPGQNQAQVVTTDESGRFTFPPQRGEPFVLIVTHDLGFAGVNREQFEKSSEIRLEPWSRIEGQVLLGDKPDANRMVNFYPKLDDDRRPHVHYCDYWTKTDAQGRFELDRVIPGPGAISRVVETKGGGLLSGWQQAIDVPSSTTTTVTIAGTGRAVVGRIELDRKPHVAIDWTTTEPVTIQRWDIDNDRAHEQTFKGHSNLDEAGRFEIPDVPPGSYRLTCHVWGAVSRDSDTHPPKIGNAQHDFTVPPLADTRSDDPLDLETITVKVETAPE